METEELKRELKWTASGRKGARQRLTNLRRRTTDLVEYLDTYVMPTLKTTRKSQCADLVEQVRRLL